VQASGPRGLRLPVEADVNNGLSSRAIACLPCELSAASPKVIANSANTPGKSHPRLRIVLVVIMSISLALPNPTRSQVAAHTRKNMAGSAPFSMGLWKSDRLFQQVV